MELRENSVLIFKNDKKNSESHPDYKGSINVDGRTLDIALWVKEGAKGKFFSGKVSEPYHKAEAPESNVNYSQDSMTKEQEDALNLNPDNTGDDLPFIITIFLAVGTLLPMLL